MGRRKGSKNKNAGASKRNGHGGDRRSKAYQDQKSKREEARRLQKGRLTQLFKPSSDPIFIPHPLSEDNLEQSKEMLREVLEHPSMPKVEGIPVSGDVDDENNDVDYQLHEEGSDFTKDPNPYYRQTYCPPIGTPLHEVLETAKKSIERDDSLKQRKWYEPYPALAMSKRLGGTPNAGRFYKEILVRIWIPKKQYGHQYVCPFCGNANPRDKGSAWRPAFAQGSIHWVFHHRYQCQHDECKGDGTGRYFTTIDQAFISKLPTEIAAEFEYMFPSKGPGIMLDMVRMLSLTTSNHVLPGTFASHVNQLQWQRYYTRSNQYYALLNLWLDPWPSIDSYDGKPPCHANGYQGDPFEPYSAFGEAGYHNGILMTKEMAKQFFYALEGGRRLKYMQNSFPAWHDDGLREDDTHKLPKKVFLNTSGRTRIQPWTAVGTLLAKSGKVVASVFKYTKSHDVTERILEGVKIARVYSRAGPLKTLQTDHPAGVETPYYKAFPELKEGVAAYHPLPQMTIPSEKIQYFKKENEVHMYILSHQDHFGDQADIFYGLDTEFDRDSKQLHILSLSFPNTELPILVLHLSKMKRFPAALHLLLTKPNMIAVGCSIGTDCALLENQYKLRIPKRIDLTTLCQRDRTDLPSYRLEFLTEVYLKWRYPVSKSAGQSADYSVDKLSSDDILYCAFDALVSRLVGNEARKMVESTQPQSSYQVMKRDQVYEVTHRGSPIASGKLSFIGAEGRQLRWGSQTLGKDKCLIDVEQIYKPKHILAKNQRFVDLNAPENTWPEHARTLEELWDFTNGNLQLAVPVLRIRPVIGSDKSRLVGGGEDSKLEWVTEVPTANGGLVADSLDDEPNLQQSIPEDLQKSLEKYIQRTKSLRDLFHQFHNLPLGKNSIVIAHIYMMVIAATWINNDEDYDNVVSVLREKGVKDIAVHEYHNREFWRQRVRRGTAEPEVLAQNLEEVEEFIWSTPEFEPHRPPQLREWFQTFASNARKGLYQIPADMRIYSKAGSDSDGLALYTTDFGTCLNETLHQKYSDLVGPYSIGIKMADILLVLRTFRFNVAVGISKCGEPDFGTDRHDIVDQTQHWILRNFGVFAWPTHKNLLDFEPPANAATVGIVPLPFNERHVLVSPTPREGLSEDHAYMSGKLGVAVAPTPLAGVSEFKLYNSHLQRLVRAGQTNPKAEDWDSIAVDFLEKTNGKTIFPKTVDLLKKYHKRWKHLQEIRLFAKSVKARMEVVMKGLRDQRCDPPPLKETQLPTRLDGSEAKKNLSEMKNFVPPDAAPQQQRYIKLEPTEKREGPFHSGKSEKSNDGPAKELPVILDHKLDELSQKDRHQLSKRCVWYPWCLCQVLVCGGRRRHLCKFHGHKTEDEFKRMKKENAATIKGEDARARKRQRLVKKAKDGSLTNSVLGGIAPISVSLAISKPSYGREGRGGVVVEPGDMLELATTGEMISNQVVDGYLNLLVNSGFQLGFRKVDGGFFPQLRDLGFQSVRSWLEPPAPIYLIPGFFGPNTCGHWIAVIVDRDTIQGKTLILVVDSLSSRARSLEAVQSSLRNFDLGNDIEFILVESPNQFPGSNDCAVFMLGAFLHWLKTRNTWKANETLRPRRLVFSEAMESSEYGQLMRRHVYETLSSGRFDAGCDTLNAMDFQS